MPSTPSCNGRSAPLVRPALRRSTGAALLLLLAMILPDGARGAAAPPAGAPPVPSPFSLLPETAALGAGERSDLLGGEVLVRFAARRGRGSREGVGIGVVEAPPERVYAALADWAHWEEFMPFLERSDAAVQPDGSVLVSQLLALPAPLGERRFVVRGHTRVDGPRPGRVWRAAWAQVPGSGNVAAHRGSWALVRLAPGRTLAVCRMLTDPGDTPAWAADRATGKSLPWIFKGLRLQVRRSRYDAP